MATSINDIKEGQTQMKYRSYNTALIFPKIHEFPVEALFVDDNYLQLVTLSKKNMISKFLYTQKYKELFPWA